LLLLFTSGAGSRARAQGCGLAVTAGAINPRTLSASGVDPETTEERRLEGVRWRTLDGDVRWRTLDVFNSDGSSTDVAPEPRRLAGVSRARLDIFSAGGTLEGRRLAGVSCAAPRRADEVVGPAGVLAPPPLQAGNTRMATTTLRRARSERDIISPWYELVY